MSVNKVILIGNVGRDPEMRYPEKDHPVAFLTLATNERLPNSETEITEWHILVMTGRNAEYAERYIRKGTKLYIEGKLRTRTWQDSNAIKRNITEIIVERFDILSRAMPQQPSV